MFALFFMGLGLWLHIHYGPVILFSGHFYYAITEPLAYQVFIQTTLGRSEAVASKNIALLNAIGDH
jgi:hypothetical protein